jgi:hypothetical protein
VPIETSLTELKINVLTKAEFETQLSLGNIDPNEFYITEDGEYAPIDSPNFIGTPTAPTATAGTNTTQIATTSFVQSAISDAVANKVDKVAGKGLSTEDYTTTEKNKLAGIEAGAQVNTVTSVAGKTGAVTLAKSDVGLGNVDNVKQMPIAGGTFTGIATAQSNTSYTTAQVRNIILSTSDPSGGNNGDIWIKYST